MTRVHSRFTISAVALFIGLLPSVLAAQEAAQKVNPVDLQEVLSWLPEDTETITVARGPYVLPDSEAKQDEDEDRAVTEQELTDLFETLPVSLFGFKDGLMHPRLKGKRMMLAIEGARHFRPPAGFGEMLYEGCALALFADDLNDDIASLAKIDPKSFWKVERIEGQATAVFREKLENDIWTDYVAFPSKRMLVVATNRDYLREVLVRLHGKKGNRALPNDLPEWKYVNTELRFWGLRHFDKSQAKVDPTSPFGAHIFTSRPDDQAIGLAFAFDQSNGRTPTITYLSGDKSLGRELDGTFLSRANFKEAKALQIEYRELAPGIVEASYTLKMLAQVQIFSFVFCAMLGHAVFI